MEKSEEQIILEIKMKYEDAVKGISSKKLKKKFNSLKC